MKVNYEGKLIPLYGMQSPFDELETSSKKEACQLMSYLMFEKGIKIFISLQKNKYEKEIWENLKYLHPVFKSDNKVKYIDFIINDYCPMSLEIASKLLKLLTINLINNKRYIPTVIHCGAGCGRTGSVMMLIRMYIEAINGGNIYEKNSDNETENLKKKLNDFYRYNSAVGKASIVLSNEDSEDSNKTNEHSPAVEFFNQDGKGRTSLLRINMNTIRYAIYKFLKPKKITKIDFYKRKGVIKTITLEQQKIDSVDVKEIERKIKTNDTNFKEKYFAMSSY